ncbi:hypothetical protein SCD_n01192 [Sulfuricella denitrificans skB26]|uniref:Winged helix-turn-helix domain-containing protein n=1 Tax=Sulfuricella denitrificans (strain DSM 22764 / NBRC 105220 / skB26) TaxID=1163617 RepID=S6AG99_SULDS|nr:helix-turn-helix domain-containing protein [Sulfuricella denitrificans]BAN35021.1 hypothetical protein SCD_n01192 [Sulfuricella denitrificans skB26]
MDNKNGNAPLAGKGEGKKTRSNFNSFEAQRQRLMDWFRTHGMIDTITARRDLDIMMPAARVHELRHRHGHQIDLVWVQQPTDCGRLHRVGQYVFHPEA